MSRLRPFLLAAIASAVVGAPLAAAPATAAAAGSAGVAWGYNFQTQLGAGYKSGHQDSPVGILGLSTMTSLAAAYHFSLALISGGTVKAWGGDDKGQLGNGSFETSAKPVEVKGLKEVKAISSAGSHALALLSNGTVMSWGSAEYGERGNGESGFEAEAKEKEPNYPARNVPALIPHLEHVTAISSGGASNFALLENGTLMSWGEDGLGILGLGEGGPEECKGEIGTLPCSTIPRPVKLPEGTTVTALSGGGEAAYALLSSGEVLAWGNNGRGQLGNGSTNPTNTPTKVELPKLEEELKTKLEVVSISGGDLFALALLKTGEVIGWGGNGYGNLGGTSSEECNNKNPCNKTPKLVGGLAEVGAVSAGRSFSLALKGGKIYSFGDNEPWGQLGIGSTTNTNVPTEIKGLEPVIGIAAGEQHSLALLQSGSPPPPPEYTVLPEPSALDAVWTVNASEYHLRWRSPPRKGKWSKIVKSKGPCTPEKVCSHTISGLNKTLYEVQLITFNNKKQDEIKKAEATPE